MHRMHPFGALYLDLWARRSAQCTALEGGCPEVFPAAQVLYLTEPIDEPAINNIGEFNEFKFVDVTREGLDLGDIPEEEKKKVTTKSS